MAKMSEKQSPKTGTVSELPSSASSSIRQGFWDVTPSLLVVAVMVIWSAIFGGRSTAERAITDFAMPLGLCWLTGLWAVTFCLRRRRWLIGSICLLFWLLLTLGSSNYIANALGQYVRYVPQTYPASEIEQPLDAIVLLGGYAYPNRFNVAELGSDGQRLLLAAQLLHANKTKTVICTGTSASGQSHPSAIGKQMLVSLGGDPGVIFEAPGFNTHAEMQSLQEFFSKPPDDWLALTGGEKEAGDDSGGDAAGYRLGLVTSATHMPRALRLSKTVGLNFEPLPCCLAGGGGPFNPRSLIPNAGAAKNVSGSFKEVLAKLVGR